MARTPDVDPWCASACWAHSAAVALGDALNTETAFSGALDDDRRVGAGWAWALQPQVVDDADGDALPVVVGPDPVWWFSPWVAGSLDDGSLAAGAADGAAALDALHGWRLALLGGYVPGSHGETVVGRALAARFTVRAGPVSERLVADLTDGADAWLARRTPRFRRNLRRAVRAAAHAGVGVEVLDERDPAEVMARLCRIEARSWKGAEGSGLLGDRMSEFCSRVLHALDAPERRVCVARLHGADVGFVVGGVRGARYRGLQLSYTADVASLSVGHVLQWHEICRLAASGVSAYDLGMDIAYKHAYADAVLATRSLVVSRA